MGTWGTGISSNDTFQDVMLDFMELYNEGKNVQEITKIIKLNYEEDLASEEDSNNVWFALAKAQWDCKEMHPEILGRIRKIIESKSDLKLWEDLGAPKSDIKAREKVLQKFLSKISLEKKNAKKRVKKKFIDAIFEKGDCLAIKLSNGEFCGAFVLESEKKSEFGLNLIAITDIKKKIPLTINCFEKAKVLHSKQAFGISNKMIDKLELSWYYSAHFRKIGYEVENIGNINSSQIYNPNSDYQSYSSWENLKSYIELYYSEEFLFRSNKRTKLSKLRKKHWL